MKRSTRQKPELRVVPRVMDLELAADYLSVSPDTVRGLIHRGYLSVVRIPSMHTRREHLKRVLVDRLELDRFVEENREKLVPRADEAA